MLPWWSWSFRGCGQNWRLVSVCASVPSSWWRPPPPPSPHGSQQLMALVLTYRPDVTLWAVPRAPGGGRFDVPLWSHCLAAAGRRVWPKRKAIRLLFFTVVRWWRQLRVQMARASANRVLLSVAGYIVVFPSLWRVCVGGGSFVSIPKHQNPTFILHINVLTLIANHH